MERKGTREKERENDGRGEFHPSDDHEPVEELEDLKGASILVLVHSVRIGDLLLREPMRAVELEPKRTHTDGSHFFVDRAKAPPYPLVSMSPAAQIAET